MNRIIDNVIYKITNEQMTFALFIPIHSVSAFTIGNTLTDTWKGVFRPFHQCIYAHLCLFTLACIKISNSNENLSLL